MTSRPALRLGSLCSGYGGLDLAVTEVLGSEPAWHAETDPGASAILARHWPTVPNLGDISTVDFRAVPPVDVLTAGFPCQDVSSAGLRAGIAPGTRSGLWAHVARAVEILRPSLVLIENVRGLLSARAHSDVEPCPWCLGDGDGVPALRALGAVLGDLAAVGFDAEWQGLPAARVGAAHERFRVFVLAFPAHPQGQGRQGARLQRRTPGTGGAAADTDRLGGQRHRPGRQPEERHTAGTGGLAAHAEGVGEREPADQALPLAARGQAREEPRCRSRRTAPHPSGDRRHQRRAEPARQQRGSDPAVRSGETPADAQGERLGDAGTAGVGGLPPAAVAGGPAAASDAHGLGLGAHECDVRQGQPHLDWGAYGPAIDRWADVLGRPAPTPTDDIGRLAPRFVEWLMGLPDGWVTNTPGLARSAQLRALGNGVVPQQAAAALRALLDRAPADILADPAPEGRAA